VSDGIERNVKNFFLDVFERKTRLSDSFSDKKNWDLNNFNIFFSKKKFKLKKFFF